MRRLKILTAGESHGEAILGIIDGVPSGLDLRIENFTHDASRRRAGLGRSERMKKEDDNPQILSGVRLGKTTGAPICIRIANKAHGEWQSVMQVAGTKSKTKPIRIPRPGHADFAGAYKYSLDDIRDVIERASARETAIRCALGSIARKFLFEFGLAFMSRPLKIGNVEFSYDSAYPSSEKLNKDWKKLVNEANQKYDECKSALSKLRNNLIKKGDTCGGSFQVIAHKTPVGLGSYSQAEHRLDAELASAILSIPSVKGFAIGAGIESTNMRGLKYADDFIIKNRKIRRKSNNAGGIEGGITNGEPIVLTGIVKPIPTTKSPHKSFDLKTGKPGNSFYENSDLWVVEAVGVIAESMTALVLMDSFLAKFGGDSMREIHQHFESSKSH